MNSVCFVWLVLLSFVSSAEALNPASSYSQSYTILIKGSLAGSETVAESTSDAGDLISKSDHEIFVTDGLETKRMAFSAKMILGKGTGNPISYVYRYTTGDIGDSYEVAINNNIITRRLTRGGHTSEISIPAPPNMVILDFNVYHQYDYLIRKYDVKKGGRQLFADFVPLIGNDIPVALDEDLSLEKGSTRAKYYRVEFVGIWSGSLYVDPEGRLLRLSIPSQDLEVVRKDLKVSTDKND